MSVASSPVFEVLVVFEETVLEAAYLGAEAPCEQRLALGGIPLARWHQGQLWLGGDPVPVGEGARVQLGGLTLVARPCTRPEGLPRPGLLGGMTWREGRCVLGSVLGHALLLLLIFSVPRETRVAFGAELLPASSRLVPVRVGDGGRQGGRPAQGPDGQAGWRSRAKPDGAAAVKRRPNRPAATELASKRRVPRIEARQAGILGLLRAERSTLGAATSVTSAFGQEARDALGQLVGRQPDDARGLDGLGLVGQGPGAGCLALGRCSVVASTGLGLSRTTMGGGGSGEGTISFGGAGGIGRGSEPGPGFQLAGGAADLGNRTGGVPAPAVRLQVRDGDGLTAEVVRRVIRRHTAEVKYCYERELATRPELDGRVALDLLIGPGGQVVRSALDSSTLAHKAVESCITAAASRWSFPAAARPTRVTYPFVLHAAGR